jgi:hypothetical protein
MVAHAVPEKSLLNRTNGFNSRDTFWKADERKGSRHKLQQALSNP